MEKLGTLAVVKCLLSSERSLSLPLSSIQFRATDYDLGQQAQFIYGDTVAFMIWNGVAPVFQIVDSVETAHTNRKDFNSRWEAALPLIIKAAA